MKKQNYIQATLILGLSLGSLFVGYWVADSERKELAETLVEKIESDRKFDEIETKDNIELLVSIKKGNIEIVEEYLINKAKSGIKQASQDNIELRDKALEYQESFCEGKCLGI